MTRRRWRDLTTGRRAAVLVLGSVHLVLAAAAWTDLASRSRDRVNGSRAVWATVIAVNFVGPIAWFRWGRRS